MEGQSEALLPTHRKFVVVNLSALLQLLDFESDLAITAVLLFDAGQSWSTNQALTLQYLLWAAMFCFLAIAGVIIGLQELQKLQLTLPKCVRLLAPLQAHTVYAAWKELRAGRDSESWHYARGKLALAQATSSSPCSAILVGSLLALGSSHDGWWVLASLALSVLGGSLGSWTGARVSEASLAEHSLLYLLASACHIFLVAGNVQALMILAKTAAMRFTASAWGLLLSCALSFAASAAIVAFVLHGALPLCPYCIEEERLSYGERLKQRSQSGNILGKAMAPLLGDWTLLLQVKFSEVGYAYSQDLFRLLGALSTIGVMLLPLLGIATGVSCPSSGLPWSSICLVVLIRAITLAILDARHCWKDSFTVPQCHGVGLQAPSIIGTEMTVTAQGSHC